MTDVRTNVRTDFIAKIRGFVMTNLTLQLGNH
jgi:hypothetical protein